ncbi:uncharacterized protein L203_106145 [Cryptococcus depauperatus CBS 7841]|uniref:Polysaccharide lyase 14 domain-containing protein n=1 Tax=Cryptococcus depauperatus CBS 7841 TaxID=1295531 RepID=A0AAJ8M3V5_9TREE
MLASVIVLLPLLTSISLSGATVVFEDAIARDSRALYDRAVAAFDSSLDAHGHGHVGLRPGGHMSGLGQRTRRGHSDTVQKLMRRKKEVSKKRSKKKSCKAKTTGLGTAAATATVTSPSVSGGVASSAVTRINSSASASSAAWNAGVSVGVSAGISWGSGSDKNTASSLTATATSSAPASASDSAPDYGGYNATATSSAGNSFETGTTSSSSLYPWGKGTSSWTTSDGSLSCESALKPLTAGKLADSGNAPDGSVALYASYPAGTYGLSVAGFSFYSQGAHSGVAVDTAKEVMLSYSVFFEDDFDFVKGGKMPGLYGGQSLSQAKSCSGGRQEGRNSCFSARLMWRTNGAGEIYDYLPVSYTGTDDGYGESIERGAFSWATGKWQTVAIRVKLNDAGQANGEQEVVVDGESKIKITGVTFATEADTKIYGIMAQTFFGGHSEEWASPKDQKLYFKDWTLAVLA